MTCSATPKAAAGQHLGPLRRAVRRRRGDASRTRRRGPRRGADIEGEASIEFEQAVEGTTITMQDGLRPAVRRRAAARARRRDAAARLPDLRGLGHALDAVGRRVFQLSEPCPDCLGRGLIVDDPCPDCGGSGRGASAKTMQVRIPAGVEDGQRIRLKGKGARRRERRRARRPVRHRARQSTSCSGARATT
jgi:molecular chaperone DnaJ